MAATVRRVRAMPVQDDKDRCGRCGRVIKEGEGSSFVDTRYDRNLRTDPRCSRVLRMTSGFREIEV